jgi:hypothetical protein
MPTELEYALMSGGSYLSTRDQRNQFPIPNGWTQLSISRDDNSGFEAVAFQQGTGTNPSNIVISFAGTNFGVADLAADAALGSGIVWSQQLGQAAAFYLEILQNPLYSNATISFTGHSLGGGLAALLGVFFNQQATTFDQAPFALSLGSVMRDTLIAHLKVDYGYTDQQLLALAPSLVNPLTPGNGAANVTGISVAGQLLATTLPYSLLSTIGTEQPPLINGSTGVSATDLHSQALLTLFVMNNQFRQATLKLTDLEKMLFDSSLYANGTGVDNITKDNFLERLVRHQNGNAPGVTTADAMLTRFTSDLWKLAQDGGLTMADDPTAATKFVSKALTAFAMQMYYEDTANATNANKQLFTNVTGGVQFDRADVAPALGDAKGYTLYFQNYLDSSAFTSTERQLMQSLLPTLRDWYVQAGSGGMNVADTNNRGAFMLGGSRADNLTGGSQTDLLVGNAGIDRLTGGGGNDTLLGGAGFDTYVYNTGDGTDTVNDRDDLGRLLVNGQLLSGSIRRAGDAANTFHSTDNLFTFVQSGTTLTVNGQVTVTDWQPGGLGVILRDLSALPTGTPPVIDYNNGLPSDTYVGTEEPNTPGPLGGTSNWTVSTYGGNDFPFFYTSSLGNHVVFLGAGHDYVEGALGHDRLYGEDGRDILLGGGGGDDVLEGGAGEDLLKGGPGHDVLRGGGDADGVNGDSGNKVVLGEDGNGVLRNWRHRRMSARCISSLSCEPWSSDGTQLAVHV